jgi:hypothetical protein
MDASGWHPPRRQSTWSRGVLPDIGGAAAAGQSSYEFWNGGPKRGIDGWGKTEPRHEDYQSNLEANAASYAAPPEIRSVPTPTPAPAPRPPRPVYDPNHVPGANRGEFTFYQVSPIGRFAYPGSTYQGLSSHEGPCSRGSAYQGSRPRGSSYRGSTPHGSVVQEFGSRASAPDASTSQSSDAPGGSADADEEALINSAFRESPASMDIAALFWRDESAEDVRWDSWNRSKHSAIMENETKRECDERQPLESVKLKQEKNEKHEARMRRREQENEARREEEAREERFAEQERKNEEEAKRAAKQLALQRIANDPTSNGPLARSTGPSYTAGTIQRPSEPQVGAKQDERKDIQTTLNHSGPSSAEREESGSAKPEEVAWVWDNTPATVIVPSSPKIRFTFGPASTSQADRGREEQDNATRAHPDSLSPSQPSDRYFNINASTLGNSSVSGSTRSTQPSGSHNGKRQETTLPTIPHANANHLKWQDSVQPAMGQTTNIASTSTNAVASLSTNGASEIAECGRDDHSGSSGSFGGGYSRKRRREPMTDTEDNRRPRPYFGAYVSQP